MLAIRLLLTLFCTVALALSPFVSDAKEPQQTNEIIDLSQPPLPAAVLRMILLRTRIANMYVPAVVDCRNRKVWGLSDPDGSGGGNFTPIPKIPASTIDGVCGTPESEFSAKGSAVK